MKPKIVIRVCAMVATVPIHFHVAPAPGTTAAAVLDELVGLGATAVDQSHACPGATALADVDGNTFCVVEQSIGM